MKYNLRKLINHNNILLLFLFILVISIGLISNNVSEVRDPRPKAATTVTFAVSVDSNDGYTLRQGTSYPPPFVGVNIDNPYVFIDRSYLSSKYGIFNGLVRWNTASLPNDATIISAKLLGRMSPTYDADSRNLVADWYNAWPIDEADSTIGTGSGTAIPGFPISSIAGAGSDQDFPLSNSASNISNTGYTGLRFFISGGQPTGRNQVSFASYNNSDPSLKLIVTYTTPDTTKPSVPGNLRVTSKTTSSVSLAWNASSDSGGSGLAGYKVYRGGSLIKTTTSTSYTNTGLSSGTSYSYYVRSYDNAGNHSGNSNTVNVTTSPLSPPPDDGGTPQPPPPGGGLPPLPSSPIGNEIDPSIVNFLKINLSVPFLLGNVKSPLIVGGFAQDLELKPGQTDYEVDVRGAKFALGKTLNIQIGGNKALIKKLKIKTKAPKQPVQFGSLYLGDINRDNRINQKDIDSYLLGIVTQDESADVNADGVVNSLDWAIILANFGKVGSK